MYVLDLRNLQAQVKKAFCFKNCTELSLFESFSITKSNFSHSRSEQFWQQNTISSCRKIKLLTKIMTVLKVDVMTDRQITEYVLTFTLITKKNIIFILTLDDSKRFYAQAFSSLMTVQIRLINFKFTVLSIFKKKNYFLLLSCLILHILSLFLQSEKYICQTFEKGKCLYFSLSVISPKQTNQEAVCIY